MNAPRFIFLLVSLTLILSACAPAMNANTDSGAAAPPIEENTPPPVAGEDPTFSHRNDNGSKG